MTFPLRVGHTGQQGVKHQVSKAGRGSHIEFMVSRFGRGKRRSHLALFVKCHQETPPAVLHVLF